MVTAVPEELESLTAPFRLPEITSSDQRIVIV
jgi:hypothetical protein